MRRSLEEPNRLRATAPIIATSSFQTRRAPLTANTHHRVGYRFRLFAVMHCSSSPSARIQAAENAGLFGLLQGGFCNVIGAPKDRCREIGGGGFIVNVRLFFTPSLGAGPILPLPSGYDSASVRAAKTPLLQGALPLYPKDRIPWPLFARPSSARLACWFVPYPCPHRLASGAALLGRASLGRRTKTRWSPASTASISARATSPSPRRRSAATCRPSPPNRSATTWSTIWSMSSCCRRPPRSRSSTNGLTSSIGLLSTTIGS